MTDPYVYPGTDVLRNLGNIKDAAALDRFERWQVAQRTAEGIPKGKFDLDHLKAIHRHLFQDVYEWAGQIRTVEISKGGDQFQFRRFIETGMADVHRRLVSDRLLQNTDPARFAEKAARIIGDINHVHPFREGNGRTQLYYLQQLARQAGHEFAPAKLDRAQWIRASIEAHQTRYQPMAQCIQQGLSRTSRER